jgi:hypothetical protein
MEALRGVRGSGSGSMTEAIEESLKDVDIYIYMQLSVILQ